MILSKRRGRENGTLSCAIERPRPKPRLVVGVIPLIMGLERLGLVRWEEEKNGKHSQSWSELEYLWRTGAISGRVSYPDTFLFPKADEQNAPELPT
jgi:hypothetical protein